MLDPPEMQGLAHFTEHMLFYSSEKYPVEDEYSKFISDHGGHTNAFTAAEDTNYQFDVNWDHLEPALDRFAQFFIAPLISGGHSSSTARHSGLQGRAGVQSSLYHFCTSLSPPHSSLFRSTERVYDTFPTMSGLLWMWQFPMADRSFVPAHTQVFHEHFPLTHCECILLHS